MMTSALVGLRPPAVDDTAGTVCGAAGAEAGAGPKEAGAEPVPGTAELCASPVPGGRTLLEAADDIVGTGAGFAGFAAEQPESTTKAAAAQMIGGADPCRVRCDRTPLLTKSCGRPRARTTVPS